LGPGTVLALGVINWVLRKSPLEVKLVVADPLVRVGHPE
jgi:hypothetical protein